MQPGTHQGGLQEHVPQHRRLRDIGVSLNLMQPTDLARLIRPDQTVLFLGAGSAVPSGAPTAKELAEHLCLELAGEILSDDLTEAATILENRYGRQAVVDAVRSALMGLQPTGGLLALPARSWHTIYTTNYDELIESAYKRAAKALNVVISNYDYGDADGRTGTPLFKIHGSISQDEVDGSRVRMVLTQRDYDQAESYREVIFGRLALDMLTKDILFIGHSLRDVRLQSEVRRVAELHAARGTPGRLFLLSYQSDPDRARIFTDRGFAVASGGIDEFFDAVATAAPSPARKTAARRGTFTLPEQLLSVTVDCSHAKGLAPNPARLFNGSPASYADIANDLTFPRALEPMLLSRVADTSQRFLAIIGVAGVGKTTLARRLMLALEEHAFLCFEHRWDFPFRAQYWSEVDRHLARLKRHAVLLVDDCSSFLNQLNRLVDQLGQREDAALRIIVTSSRSLWLPRNKSPQFFRHGHTEELSELADADLDQLLNLLDRRNEIRQLIDRSFRRKGRDDKLRILRRRSRADMYVCLKNVFASEDLDNILLREYADLPVEQQGVYRSVAALEAGGTRVHRQLLVRLLGIPADTIRGLLDLMQGIVTEYDIEPSEGIYGWATRHPVIAERIAHYKYGDQDELYALISAVIDHLNPSISVELRTLRDLCNYEYGIRGLTHDERQVDLYRRLIALAPGERIPRHRIIAKYLRMGDLEAARQEIRVAEEEVNLDPPIGRYKVRVALQRAETARGVREEDRIVMFGDARSMALQNIRQFPADKYAYIVYGEVAKEFTTRYRDTKMLKDAIVRMRRATARIPDPQLGAELDELIRMRARFEEVTSAATPTKTITSARVKSSTLDTA